MQATAEVIVIGAGVIGCSTAYHLARLGISDVALLEMDQVGSGSSSKSAAMLTLQFCEDELIIRMAKYCYERYMQFEQELGTPIDFRRTGWVSLATERNAAALRRNAELLQSLDVTTEILTPGEIKRRFPEIHTEDLALGTWGPDDGSLDPHMIMWAYVNRAKSLGVRLHQGVRATGIRVRGGKVEGVQTDQGFLSTRVVVNAAGPWAPEVGRWAGVPIPQVNSARTIVVTHPFPDIPSDRPFVDDLTAEWYYRPEGPGILMGMGDEPSEDYAPWPTSDMINAIIDVAVHRVPVLEKAAILTAWTGIRPLTPDGRPILGPVPAVEGLVLSCGWAGTGIIQAPIAGQLVAELVAAGRTATMDIAPLSIERFQA